MCLHGIGPCYANEMCKKEKGSSKTNKNNKKIGCKACGLKTIIFIEFYSYQYLVCLSLT
jgi:hypothetical protein